MPGWSTVQRVAATDLRSNSAYDLIGAEAANRHTGQPRSTQLRPRYSCCCFFFQAEDGIRDLTVTGVQTCALPISSRPTINGVICCGKMTMSRTGIIGTRLISCFSRVNMGAPELLASAS